MNGQDVYTYNFPADTKFLKSFGKALFSHTIVLPFTNWRCYLVFTLFFVETLQTALSGADIYYWFATGFGDMNRVTSPYASPFDVPIMGSFVSLSVQFFFAYRLWVLGNKKNWWLPTAICVVSPLCRIRLSEVLIIFVGFYR